MSGDDAGCRPVISEEMSPAPVDLWVCQQHTFGSIAYTAQV